MKKEIFLFIALVALTITSSAQSGSTGETFRKPYPRNYNVKQAFEIESLVPMLFIGRTFYIQPGIHSYFRSDQSLTFSDGGIYNIPPYELSLVVRIGARLWKKYR